MQQAQNPADGKMKMFVYGYFNVLSIVISLVVIIIGVVFFIKPKYYEILDLQEKELAKYTEIVNKKEKHIYKLLDLEAAYSNIGHEDKDKINSILKSGNNPEEQFRQLEKLVKSNGSVITSLKIAPFEKKKAKPKSGKSAAKDAGSEGFKIDLPEEIGIMQISMDVDGVNYAGFKSLLSAIENSVLFLDVQDIEFQPGSRTAKIKMNTYYLADK